MCESLIIVLCTSQNFKMVFKRIKKTEMNRERNSEINKTITLHIKIIKLAVSKS